jgi:hypothetical protein
LKGSGPSPGSFNSKEYSVQDGKKRSEI